MGEERSLVVPRLGSTILVVVVLDCTRLVLKLLKVSIRHGKE